MRESLGQNFLTKNRRKVALTGWSRSSETQTQWTDVRAAADPEVPAPMKTLTRWTIWFRVKTTSPELTTQSVKYHGEQALPKSPVVRIIKRICRWIASRGDVCKSWLRQTSPLAWSALSYFWSEEVFAVFRGLHLHRWKGVHWGFAVIANK